MSTTSQQHDIEKLLTIVISTSPLPSHPSTAVIEAVLDAHNKHCPELVKCKKIVVLDGYKISATARLKKGNITEAIAEGYVEYKARLKKLLLTRIGDDGNSLFTESHRLLVGGRRHYAEIEVTKSSDEQLAFLEPNRQLGFALGLRAALDQVKTPYVFVQQHDWAFCAPVPIADILNGMEACSAANAIRIDYVTFNTRWTTHYSAHQISHDKVLRVLESTIKRAAAQQTDPDVLKLVQDCTPLLYWLDRPHTARVSTYMEHVFGHGLFSAGDFIEDVFGQKMAADMRAEVALWDTKGKEDLEESEVRERIARSSWLGCWLYESGDPASWALVHLQGRTYVENEDGTKSRKLNVHGGIRQNSTCTVVRDRIRSEETSSPNDT